MFTVFDCMGLLSMFWHCGFGLRLVFGYDDLVLVIWVFRLLCCFDVVVVWVCVSLEYC